MKTICVIGMGRSGEGAARLALHNGLGVRLLEQKQTEQTLEKAKILRTLGVEVFLGAHGAVMLDKVEEIVVSPGVNASSEIFVWARERGIPVVGEMEWATRQFMGKVIAVTGTNGKTTTTALIAHLANENGISAVACGNIGTPLSQVILSGEIPQVAVAEISSFQLETIESFHPAISVFLNFTPDHLDRHATLNEYWLAKLRVYKNQGPGDTAIVHRDLYDRLESLLASRGINPVTFGLDETRADVSVRDGIISWRGRGKLCAASDVPLLGNHNLENACAASAVATLLELRAPAIARAMKTFRAVDHRLQPVGRLGKVRFINDSKATNVDSLSVALRSFPEKVVLIAGGKHKNQDFSLLRSSVEEKVRSVVLIGEGAEKIAADWAGTTEILRADSLENAVKQAFERAQPEGVVLLSPACASFDMFADYEHRGREFVRCVGALSEGGGHAFDSKEISRSRHQLLS